MKCAAFFSGCTDPDRWKQTQTFVNRIHPAIDRKSQVELNFNHNGNIIFKFSLDEDVIDFVRMVAHECDCDDIWMAEDITIRTTP